MRALLRLFVVAVVLCPLTANATIINIPGDYPTIQEGIDHGADGDTVLVQPDTYFENLNFNGHNVVLASLFLTTGDTSYVSNTIIDGGYVARVLIFSSGETSTAQVVGFTIQHGYSGYGGYGGGIYCGASSPTIRNNVITNNSALSGGGLFCEFPSRPTISSNIICGNSADFGGGMTCHEYCYAEISGNTVVGNSANFTGGGIHSHNASPTISHNSVADNSAMRYGGGIGCRFFYGTISSNSVSGNSAYWGGGGVHCRDSSPLVTNTILWGDTAPSGREIYLDENAFPTFRYCDVQGGWPGEGNIDDDPLFVDPGAGDFHLQWGSPCIDTGDPNSPPDPDGTRADMGALYFHQGLLFSPDAYAFNLLIESSAEKTLSLENVGADTAFFSLSTDVDWISFLPDSGCLTPDSSIEVSVTFDGSGLPLGPNEATISLEVVTAYGHLEHEIPVTVYIFSLEYTYISLIPDTLPIVIPPEGGSFSCWAQVYNSSDFLYRFDIWIDATMPDGSTYGPIRLRENFRFRPGYSESRHLTQNVPAGAPPGEYSYNCKMGVFPDQVDYQDSFSFTKLEAGSPPGMARVSSWDLFGWHELSVHYVGDQGKAEIVPTEYLLSQNYPNPFNAVTTVSYQLPVGSHVKLEVYNLFGQKVATLVDEGQGAGYKSVSWDASEVSSGLYFYRLTAGDYTDTRRMMLVR